MNVHIKTTRIGRLVNGVVGVQILVFKKCVFIQQRIIFLSGYLDYSISVSEIQCKKYRYAVVFWVLLWYIINNPT